MRPLHPFWSKTHLMVTFGLRQRKENDEQLAVPKQTADGAFDLFETGYLLVEYRCLKTPIANR